MANEQEPKSEPNNEDLVDSHPVQQGEEAVDDQNGEWKASKSTKLAFASICVLALMAALDGTSIGVALPVRTPIPNATIWYTNGYLELVTDFKLETITGYRQGTEWNRN
jgi:hypothetical protein